MILDSDNMCGRYGFVPGENFYNRFEIKNRLEKLEARYNVSPGMMMPVITSEKEKEVSLMRWGLIPFWAKDPKIGYKMINARAESLMDKPSFRKPLVSQRCLIPTSGFFEWRRLGKDKIPYYIGLKDTELFVFAGLFDIWKDAEGYPLKTFTIITTAPNALVAQIHDRMPVILDKEFEDIWLDKNITDTGKLVSMFKSYPVEKMISYQVSQAVNNPVNDGENLIRKEVNTLF
jgi:putative SOS response-associated peptidase YedK